MAEKFCPQWDPRSEDPLNDQIHAYDQIRRRCPVAHSEYLHWSVFRHADVSRVLQNPEVFSNVVSGHPAIPNGMDPPEHTEYRRIIDRYFSPPRMMRFEPVCRNIASRLLLELSGRNDIELAAELADLFAIRVQCAFLNWPATAHAPLLQWTHNNHAATRSGDKEAMAAVAVEFDGHIRNLLAQTRNRAVAEDGDPMASLLTEQINGRPLTDGEVVSILRNWTVGELSTISACVGILVHYLAEHQELQHQFREDSSLLPKAIDEILRIHPPLISSRRKTTQSVTIGSCLIPAGERVTIMWPSANRDEGVFADPDEFRLDRDPAQNLLYGAGIHVCPGAPLARLELRILLEELLKRSRVVVLAPDKKNVRAVYPRSGFSSLPIRIDWTG